MYSARISVHCTLLYCLRPPMQRKAQRSHPRRGSRKRKASGSHLKNLLIITYLQLQSSRTSNRLATSLFFLVLALYLVHPPRVRLESADASRTTIGARRRQEGCCCSRYVRNCPFHFLHVLHCLLLVLCLTSTTFCCLSFDQCFACSYTSAWFKSVALVQMR